MALDRDELKDTLGALEIALSRGESPRALAPLAEARRLRGEIEDAIRTARGGVEAFPEHVGVRIVLARALADAGRRTEAEEVYRAVLDRDPENVEARVFLVPEAPLPRTAPEATDAAASAGALSPRTLHDELSNLADLFSTRPELDEETADADDLSGIATLTLAEIYARQGLPDRAIDVCETILRRDPDDPEAKARLEVYRKELATIE
jgi:tetratricopeptide (TPR) repeat protein